MASVGVSTTGIPQAAGKLERIGSNARQQGPTMKDAGSETARSITGIPIRTGRLASSPEVIVSGDYGFVVGSKVPYARYVFRGTKYVSARPPRVPSDIGRRTAYALSRGIVYG